MTTLLLLRIYMQLIYAIFNNNKYNKLIMVNQAQDNKQTILFQNCTFCHIFPLLFFSSYLIISHWTYQYICSNLHLKSSQLKTVGCNFTNDFRQIMRFQRKKFDKYTCMMHTMAQCKSIFARHVTSLQYIYSLLSCTTEDFALES